LGFTIAGEFVKLFKKTHGWSPSREN
jgi:hypothetical protein